MCVIEIITKSKLNKLLLLIANCEFNLKGHCSGMIEPANQIKPESKKEYKKSSGKILLLADFYVTL